jgi:phage tail sheath protein FI
MSNNFPLATGARPRCTGSILPSGLAAANPARWVVPVQRALGTGIEVLRPSSGWQYVNDRRLGVLIEQSLPPGQWHVFQPDSTWLWSRVVLSVVSFLTRLEQQGALAPSRPPRKGFFDNGGNPLYVTRAANGVPVPAASGPAYFVTCDPSTLAADSLASGVVSNGGGASRGMRLIVGFAPRRVDEFMILVLGARHSK